MQSFCISGEGHAYYSEPLHGVLGSWEYGGQNNQGAGSRVGKSQGAGSRRTNLGSTGEKSREQGAEENMSGAVLKYFREQGDSKNNLGSSEILIWGTPKK